MRTTAESTTTENKPRFFKLFRDSIDLNRIGAIWHLTRGKVTGGHFADNMELALERVVELSVLNRVKEVCIQTIGAEQSDGIPIPSDEFQEISGILREKLAQEGITLVE